uniref:Uncharacterized protein n=1 Tax=Bursaphelenchus xylophilus TaxID=6326 RepID=A0A1I7RTW6_BURXY
MEVGCPNTLTDNERAVLLDLIKIRHGANPTVSFSGFVALCGIRTCGFELALQNLESFAPREHRKHFRTIRWIVAFRKELPSILPTEEEVQDFLDSLTPAELMELVKPSVDKLLDDAKHYTMEFADTFIATVEKRAGNCGELKRIVVDLRTEVCDNTIDIYNTVWLSFLHIIVILIPFVVIGGALGRLH